MLLNFKHNPLTSVDFYQNHQNHLSQPLAKPHNTTKHGSAYINPHPQAHPVPKIHPNAAVVQRIERGLH